MRIPVKSNHPSAELEWNPQPSLSSQSFLFNATGIAFIVGTSLLFPNPLMERLWELNKPAEPAFRAMGPDFERSAAVDRRRHVRR
jgi:hypothetical protein